MQRTQIEQFNADTQRMKVALDFLLGLMSEHTTRQANQAAADAAALEPEADSSSLKARHDLPPNGNNRNLTQGCGHAPDRYDSGSVGGNRRRHARSRISRSTGKPRLTSSAPKSPSENGDDVRRGGADPWPKHRR
jgi:hypothetical protein